MPFPSMAALVAAAACELVEVASLCEASELWLALGALVALEAALLELSLEPPMLALVGSSVPHLDLMLALHSSCALELPVLAAMQSE